MQITYSEYSSIGGRKKNEDMVSVISYPQNTVLLVADGLGGHGDGDVASRMAVHLIGEALANRSVSQEALESAVCLANDAILEKQHDARGMKTTIAALWIDGGRACSAHVGDSRIYQFRDHRLKFQSMDHSVSQMAMLMGEIEASEIRTHCDRNRLTRALGAGRSVKVDASTHDVRKGDAFLLCSDGFWEWILEEEMLEDLGEKTDAKEWLDAMRNRIDGRLKPDADNNSAIALIVI